MRDRWLWIGCALHAVLFAVLGAIKYAAHRNLVDFGIFAQTVASAFGCFCNPLEGSHWAFHFSPILYPVGIAVAFAHTPLTLIGLQSMAGALCAPPVYALVARRCGRSPARIAAAIAWLYPALAGLIFGDFHENVFAPAAVLWLAWAFDARRWGWTAAFALTALAVKEDQAALLFVNGLGAACWYRGDRARARAALAIAMASLVVFAAFFLIIRPHAAADAGWQPERFYAWTAADAGAIGSQLLGRFGFLLLVFAPLAFVPLRTPLALLTVAPLGEVLLSRMSTTYTIGTHYAGAWIGYVLIAFAGGAVAMQRAGRFRIAAGWAIGLCVLQYAVANPLHPGLNLHAPQARDRALDAALGELPAGAAIATQEEAYTHLALDDPLARLLPEHAQDTTHACLILIDRDYPQSPRLVEYDAALQTLVASRRYAALAHRGGVELYRSTTACR